MKKCPRCDIVYHAKARFYCLYCDAQLIPGEFEDFFRREAEAEKAAHTVLPPVDRTNLLGMQYALSNYFRVRSFAFSYTFCRNQMKFSPKFQRLFIEPINMTSFIRLPWLLINIVDSFWFHLTYQAYCPHCQWKYKRYSGRGGVHTLQVCAYNKSYSALLDVILNGKILTQEEKFEGQWFGGRNAYHKLCGRKSYLEMFSDVVSILFSLGIYVGLVAFLVVIIFILFYPQGGTPETEGMII